MRPDVLNAGYVLSVPQLRSSLTSLPARLWGRAKWAEALGGTPGCQLGPTAIFRRSVACDDVTETPARTSKKLHPSATQTDFAPLPAAHPAIPLVRRPRPQDRHAIAAAPGIDHQHDQK